MSRAVIRLTLVTATTLLAESNAVAFLDFIGEQTKKAAETAAYTDAVADLASEMSPENELKSGALDLKNRAERLRSEANETRYLTQTTKDLMSGPDWTSKRLETNIRNTTDFVRRLKRLISRIAILGTDGATALNTAETNVALNAIQKNQQSEIMIQQELKISQLERENEEAKVWQQFVMNQRNQRGKRNDLIR